MRALALVSRLVFSVLFAVPALAATPWKPSIVFIITDDPGYGDLGYTGNLVVTTPPIDRLAAGSRGVAPFATRGGRNWRRRLHGPRRFT